MKLFLILVSLYSIIQTCYSVPCQSLPPGLDRLSHGIDITKFDLLPEDMINDNGIGRNIFDFTCTKARKWTNPFVPTLTYDLPDQIDSITNLPGGVFNQKVETSNNMQDRMKHKSTNLGLELTLGAASLSHTTTKDRHTNIGGDRVLTTVSAHVSAIVVDMLPYFAQTPGAIIKQFFDQLLPNTYQENPAKFQEFLTTFGTHYFTTAHFGGLMKVEIGTNSDYANRTDAKTMELQAKATFAEKLTLHGQHNTGSTAVDNNFKQNSDVHEVYYGGDANLINKGLEGFQGWWDSAQRNPWIFDGKLVSILTFLPNVPKKNALNTAIAVKLDYAYLDELADSLAILKQNPYIDVAAANTMVNQVAALRAQVVPSHPAVAQLGAAVGNFVNVQRTKRAPVPACNIKTDLDKKGHVVKRTCVNPPGAATCKCSI